jgi:hypothetical protein
MTVYCLDDFKKEFEKLKKNKSYNDIEIEIIGYFFNKSINELLSGTRLNNSETSPYIKKRLKGRGGYRFYFLIIIKDENLFLMFVHPKTGAEGATSITEESKSHLYKKILSCIKSNDLYLVTLNEDNTRLLFSKVSVDNR